MTNIEEMIPIENDEDSTNELSPIKLSKVLKKQKISHKEAAEKLDISIEVLRQRIYKNSCRNRDWLIAICAVYGVDPETVSEIMVDCNMPPLNSSKRDKRIYELLEKYKLGNVFGFKLKNIESFNRELSGDGNEIEPLKLHMRNRDDKKTDSQITFKPVLHEIRERSYSYRDEREQYSSLCTKYDVSLVEFYVTAYLDDVNLIVSDKGDIKVYDNEWKLIKNVNSKYDSICKELRFSAYLEKQKFIHRTNDTKNFKKRYSANIKKDKLHVFCEEFNYDNPIEDEYIMMEYIEGKYILTISSQSLFMQEYLLDSYEQFYGKRKKGKVRSYDSIDDIEYRFYKAPKSYRFLKEETKERYSRLKEDISKKIQDLLESKTYIQNLVDPCWDDESEILGYYNICEEFECRKDGEIRFKQSADFKNDKGEIVNLAFEDIKDAFKLGIRDIQEIIRLKCKYGNLKIESFI